MQTQTLEDARRLIAAFTDPDGLPESPVLIYNDDQREGTSYLRLSISYGKGDDGYRPKPRGYYLHVMRYTYDGDNIRYVRTRIGDPANFWLFASPAAVQRKSKKALLAACEHLRDRFNTDDALASMLAQSMQATFDESGE